MSELREVTVQKMLPPYQPSLSNIFIKKNKVHPYHLSPNNRKITVTLDIFQTSLFFVLHKVL